ncbi:molybdopterin biosynthesis protein [Haloarcula onubensis]|uniref:Molybdopterin biosynthesis protein n=1 Tax=Haloarcula onubensis TaxID=2950539 RepID=A0ABU2FSI0_9EURY|nr:molybdopterin biosynthesis protein [Halomicroarcula sp. S3CR25-11]MDS0283722.1 molybdopterin biosynthesis protein [Halomicroarcula sp. S3CR25-11]
MTDRREFRDLASPEEARAVVDSLDVDPGTETVALADARDRVLAERVDAALDVPGFDRASMDGYAVRARDTFGAGEATPETLELAGTVHAGEEPDVTVESGAAAEISTGAVMPAGADAVVMVERTTETDDGVEIRTAVTPGENVMLAGADIAAGARALGPGTRVTPREIGLLAALGVDEVRVRSRPRVGIVSTGDELVRPGEPIDSAAGEIYDVNSDTVAAGVEDAGGEPVLYPHAGDDFDAMERLLHEAADECDLVLSSGSTSASAVDVIYRVIEERGDLRLHGVAVKPGKPMLVGTVGESAYVGLPGYPVSALTIFRTFVAPVIREAAGLPEPRTATVTGEMAVDERYTEGRLRYMPVGLVEDGAGTTLVYPVDKGSGATTSLVDADGTVAVGADTERLPAGRRVEVTLFSPDVHVPTLFGVGEDDPLWNRLLDRVETPRYLPTGTADGRRRLREGVPDVAVVSGPSTDDEPGERLGDWDREWGLAVAPDSDVTDLAALVDGEYRFVNRDAGSGLRRSFDAAVDALADERGVAPGELTDAIDGYGLTTGATERPARKVAAGEADAGLALRATAATLGLEFVPLGTERVRVLANPDRTGKESVERLRTLLGDLDDLVASLDGFEG